MSFQSDNLQQIPINYKVQSGDSLRGLAIKFNTDVWMLKRLNRLTSNEIFEGQLLKIPTIERKVEDVEQTVDSLPSFSIDIRQSRLIKFDASLYINERRLSGEVESCPLTGKMVVTPTVIMFDECTDCLLLDTKQRVSLLFQIPLLNLVKCYRNCSQNYEERNKYRKRSIAQPITCSNDQCGSGIFSATRWNTCRNSCHCCSINHTMIASAATLNETQNNNQTFEKENYSFKRTNKQLSDSDLLRKQTNRTTTQKSDSCLLALHQSRDIDDIAVMFKVDHCSAQSLKWFLEEGCAVDGSFDDEKQVKYQATLATHHKYKWHENGLYVIEWQLSKLHSNDRISLERIIDQPTALTSILAGESRLVSKQEMCLLSGLLPIFLVDGSKRAELLFSTNQHGYHAPTLYRKMKNYEEGHNLLFVLSDANDVFGALIAAHLKVREGFYGSGESMLFTIKPKLSNFEWTGSDEYFIHCNSLGFGIGAGRGCYGLWIDQSLRRGTTSECSTYANRKLTYNGKRTERGIEFGIIEMEVWTFAYLKDEASSWNTHEP